MPDSLQQSWHNQSNWTIDDFGPIIIPAKGLTVSLNKDNRSIYNKIIMDQEQLSSIDHLKQYTFHQDYYFALGDNRHTSADSRIWGFVPADHVIGKGSIILNSANDQFSFFERWFKQIR